MEKLIKSLNKLQKNVYDVENQIKLTIDKKVLESNINSFTNLKLINVEDLDDKLLENIKNINVFYEKNFPRNNDDVIRGYLEEKRIYSIFSFLNSFILQNVNNKLSNNLYNKNKLDKCIRRVIDIIVYSIRINDINKNNFVLLLEMFNDKFFPRNKNIGSLLTYLLNNNELKCCVKENFHFLEEAIRYSMLNSKEQDFCEYFRCYIKSKNEAEISRFIKDLKSTFPSEYGNFFEKIKSTYEDKFGTDEFPKDLNVEVVTSLDKSNTKNKNGLKKRKHSKHSSSTNYSSSKKSVFIGYELENSTIFDDEAIFYADNGGKDDKKKITTYNRKRSGRLQKQSATQNIVGINKEKQKTKLQKTDDDIWNYTYKKLDPKKYHIFTDGNPFEKKQTDKVDEKQSIDLISGELSNLKNRRKTNSKKIEYLHKKEHLNNMISSSEEIDNREIEKIYFKLDNY